MHAPQAELFCSTGQPVFLNGLHFLLSTGTFPKYVSLDLNIMFERHEQLYLGNCDINMSYLYEVAITYQIEVQITKKV